MTANETLIVFLLFGLRIAIPVLITFSLAYLYDRLAARWETPHLSSQSSGEIPRTAKVASIEITDDCPVTSRAQCACARWSNIPCWLALELSEGGIPDECLKCQVFHESNLDKAQLAGV